MLLLAVLYSFAAIALGKSLGGRENSFCSRQANGQVYFWGYDGYGMFGLGRSTVDEKYPFPIQVPNVAAASDVSSGWYFACLIDQSKLKCAGRGRFLGRKSTKKDSNVLVRVGGLSKVTPKKIYVERDHACVITTKGKVFCWGDDNYGQLGNPRTRKYSKPGPVAGYGTSKTAVEVAVGTFHTCILFSDGTMACAGSNVYGQLATEDRKDRHKFVKTKAMSKVVSISAGAVHTCIARSSGEVYCWGDDKYGSPDKHIPSLVQGLRAASVWCAQSSTYAILQTNHSVIEFSKSARVLSPRLLYGGQTGIIEVRGEDSTSCILLDQGVIKCQGYNDYGQLGRGEVNRTYQALRPVVGLPVTYAPTTWPTKRPTRAPTSKPTKRPTRKR